MPRPRKCRIVGFIPNNDCFYPHVNNTEEVVLSIEEVEAIRLSDYMEMEQDSAAKSMDISRGTFQRMIHSARNKMADALIHGKRIKIEGGIYELSQGKMCCKRDSIHCKHKDCDTCGTCQGSEKNEIIKGVSFMKIAIATEGTEVSAHFGKCENFTIVEIENSEVISKEVISTIGNQHGQLPIFLLTHGAHTVISGGMGDGAKQNLKSNGIQFITGASGSVEDVILSFIEGSLKSDDSGCSDHGHGHDHGHDHGDGGCHCGN